MPMTKQEKELILIKVRDEIEKIRFYYGHSPGFADDLTMVEAMRTRCLQVIDKMICEP